jgi:hypothetical protein
LCHIHTDSEQHFYNILEEQSSHERRNRLLPTAFRHLNNGLFSSKALQFDAITLAASAIELTTEESTRMEQCYIHKTLMKRWWRWYDVDVKHLNKRKLSLIEATSTFEATSMNF